MQLVFKQTAEARDEGGQLTPLFSVGGPGMLLSYTFSCINPDYCAVWCFLACTI